MIVKIRDDATYTLVKRSNAAAGQQDYFWLGDNGREIELSDGEAAELT